MIHDICEINVESVETRVEKSVMCGDDFSNNNNSEL